MYNYIHIYMHTYVCVHVYYTYTHTHIQKTPPILIHLAAGRSDVTSILQELSLKETPVRAEHRKGSAQFREGFLYQLHL